MNCSCFSPESAFVLGIIWAKSLTHWDYCFPFEQVRKRAFVLSINWPKSGMKRLQIGYFGFLSAPFQPL